MAEAAKTGELDPKECRQILADAKEVYAPEDLGFRSGGRETDYEWRWDPGSYPAPRNQFQRLAQKRQQQDATTTS